MSNPSARNVGPLVGPLGTYLNDHLAGAVGALELIDHIADKFHGADLGDFLAQLHKDVSADEEVLRGILQKLDVQESAIRKAGAWMMEKIARLKLRLAKHGTAGVGLLEALEALVIGITGKQLLWRSLAATCAHLPPFKGLEFPELERRAVDQRDRVEQQRLKAARLAFRE